MLTKQMIYAGHLSLEARIRLLAKGNANFQLLGIKNQLLSLLQMSQLMQCPLPQGSLGLK